MVSSFSQAPRPILWARYDRQRPIFGERDP